jgi:hypothetical protein
VRGESGQPDIRGYTPEYLEASSPRRQQIERISKRHSSAGRRRRTLRPTGRAKPKAACRTRNPTPTSGVGGGLWGSARPFSPGGEGPGRRPRAVDGADHRSSGGDLREGATLRVRGRRRRTRAPPHQAIKPPFGHDFLRRRAEIRATNDPTPRRASVEGSGTAAGAALNVPSVRRSNPSCA